jgi:hypothetical protein
MSFLFVMMGRRVLKPRGRPQQAAPEDQPPLPPATLLPPLAPPVASIDCEETIGSLISLVCSLFLCRQPAHMAVRVAEEDIIEGPPPSELLFTRTLRLRVDFASPPRPQERGGDVEGAMS